MIEQDIMRKEANYHKFDFLRVDSKAKTITIKPGYWKITENVIIPSGFTFICNRGVQLDLTNSAKIVSYSPCYFVGTEANPIIIQSGDSTGQGFIVLKAGEESKLEHVIFDNLGALKQGGWELTGAVTFYESPVEIS
jgi:hypothetical protein